MMRSLFSGVSGLKSHQTRMDVIGNNIANVNTTGFKSSRVTFADTLSQMSASSSAPSGNLGGINPKQVGLGTGVASIDLIFTDSSTQATGKNTDLALSGNGLFVVKNGNETYYTRDGAFEFDSEGNYVLPGSGLKVQGWVGKDGVINTSSAVSNIQIPAGKSMAAKATTKATYANNLNSAVLKVTKMTGGDGIQVLALSDGTTVDRSTQETWNVNDVYESKQVTYNTPKQGFVYSKRTMPNVDVTYFDASTHSFTSDTLDGKYQYGFDLKTNGESATAEGNVKITAYSANPPAQRRGYTFSGTGATYRVGDKVTSPLMTSGDITTYAGEEVTLHLADGTHHDVSANAGRTYIVGTDTYTYTDANQVQHTSKVTGYTHTFPINEMNVVSNEGEGADIRVGDGNGTLTVGEGYGMIPLKANESATAQPTSPLRLKMNSLTLDNITDGKTYKIGDTYVGADLPANTSIKATAANPLQLTLDDGTVHMDYGTTNISYKTGDKYTYTYNDAQGTHTANATIAKINRLYTIEGIDVKKEIRSVNTTENVLVDSVTPPESLTATSDKPVTITQSDGSTTTVTSGTYRLNNSLPLTTTIDVYDSLGASHTVPIYFTMTKTGAGATLQDGNQWTVGVDGLDSSGTTSTITESDGTKTEVSLEPITLQFSTDGKLLSGDGTVTLTLKNGSFGEQKVLLDLTKVTQFAGNSTVVGTPDGNAAGTLKSISIDTTGTITGTYTNGVKQKEAQVAIAQFTNASGLEKTGNSLYQVSNNSGVANIKTAGDLGVDITPSALEMSNVDIANEFSDMIITQRGFQSNSKIITVGDEMLETLINMKR